MADQPDLTGARVFQEVADPPVAGGRWYLLADGETVAHQRPVERGGEWVVPAVIGTAMLQRTPPFTEVTSEQAPQP